MTTRWPLAGKKVTGRRTSPGEVGAEQCRPELRRPSRRPKFRLTKKDGTSALNPDLKNTGVPHPNFEWLEEKQTRLTQTGTAYPDRNSLPR